MPRAPISRVSLAATALFLVAGLSLLLIGLRLVASERAIAEQTARERLRARLSEASGTLLAAAARLSRETPIAVRSADGTFITPQEPQQLRPLAVLPGRDPEADFYLREAEKAETIYGEPDRARALYLAAAAEDRDETARLIALYRLSALSQRTGDEAAAARHEKSFRSLLPDRLRRSLEALLVRSRAKPPDPEFETDLLLHLGSGDDEVVLGLLERTGRASGDAVASRRGELAAMTRLGRLLSNHTQPVGAVIGDRLTVWNTQDGEIRVAQGPVPPLPGGVAVGAAPWPSPADLVETVALPEPFADTSLNATVERQAIEATARRGAALIIAALLALLAAGAAALVLALRAARRESEAAQEQATFVTKVGHDLRTPLALIRMYAETIADGRVSDPDEAREFAGIAAREAERLTDLVGDVLDLSRVAEANGALTRVRLDLAALAAEVAEAHRPLLTRAGVELTVATPGSVHVRGDPSALRGTVSNLLGNVARHGASGGTVEIAVTAREDSAVLTVSDRGPGIAPELTERVFERFVRGPDRTERGAGLGLALVREVVVAHGGQAVAANREDGGAVLTITMPIDAEAGSE